MKRNRGFSVVELLVVMGIISLLLALLVPSVLSAKSAAMAAKCSNQMRNIGQAYHSYVLGKRDVSSGLGGGWTGPLLKYLENESSVYVCPEDLDAAESSGGAGGNGNIEIIDTPPPDLGSEGFTHPTLIRLVKERSNYELPSAVTCDTNEPGPTFEFDTPNVDIPAGTVVDCYLLHWDSPGDAGVEGKETGPASVTFGGGILGVITSNHTLDASDSILGAEGTNYGTGAVHRRIEGAYGLNDTIDLSSDMRTVDITQVWIGGGSIDQMRIVTEPGAVSSYGMNNQVTDEVNLRNKVLLIEYGKTVVDFDFMGESNDDPSWIRLRHQEMSNVLFCDGRVEWIADTEFYDPTKDHWKID